MQPKTTHYRYCNCDMVQKDSWPFDLAQIDTLLPGVAYNG